MGLFVTASWCLWTGAACALLLLGCGADASPVRACDTTLAPVVMVHGLLAAGDTWANHANRFEGNGHCRHNLIAFEWNSLAFGDNSAALAQLDVVIDDALVTGQGDRVDLIGHSAGAGLAYAYLADPQRAKKVAGYVHVAGRVTDQEGADLVAPGGGVAMLNLYSRGDTIVSGRDLVGVDNVALASDDHFQVATSSASFTAIYTHLRGAAPERTLQVPSRDTVLAGTAVLFGTNAYTSAWSLAIYAVDADSRRVRAQPDAVYVIGDDGRWGPFEASRGQRYELRLAPPDTSERPVHYFIEPVTTSRPFMSLRGLPGPNTLVGALLAGLPSSGDGILIVYSSAKAVVNGRDTLTVGGRDLATDALASPDRTAIAFFLYDEGADSMDGDEAGLFAALANLGPLNAFVVAVDAVLPAGETTTIIYNDRTMTVPNLAADAGAVVAVFD